MPQPQPSAVIATTINEAADGLEARADADIIVYAGQITRSQEIQRLCRAKQHKANDPQARPSAGQQDALDGRRRREEVVNHLDDAGWPVRDAAASGEDD